jgi:hypothetical protein
MAVLVVDFILSMIKRCVTVCFLLINVVWLFFDEDENQMKIWRNYFELFLLFTKYNISIFVISKI